MLFDFCISKIKRITNFHKKARINKLNLTNSHAGRLLVRFEKHQKTLINMIFTFYCIWYFC